MRRLKDDSINLSRGVDRPRQAGVRLALPVLMLTALALMVLSRLDHSGIRAARAGLSEALAPALSALMLPVAQARFATGRLAALFHEGDELARLRARNRELEASQWRVRDIERQMAELMRQSRAVAPQDAPFHAARVIAQAGGAFTRSALVEVGREQGVRPGHPVVTVEGLVGRVVDAGRRTSTVLLISDVNSRVPVAIGAKSVRAIMVGDAGPQPRLAFAGEGAINDGDDVTTSGVGGLFPRGMRVGTVVTVAGVARVIPAAQLDDLGFVRVVLHDSELLQYAGERGATSPVPTARDGAAPPLAQGKRPLETGGVNAKASRAERIAADPSSSAAPRPFEAVP